MNDPRKVIKNVGISLSAGFLLTGWALGLTLFQRKPPTFSLEAVVLYSSQIIFYILGLVMLKIFISEEDNGKK